MTSTYDKSVEVFYDFLVEPDSSFVKYVAYSVKDATCYVVLHNTLYQYDSVDYEGYYELITAYSVGHEYHHFAVKYGPGINLGTNYQLLQSPLAVDTDFTVTEALNDWADSENESAVPFADFDQNRYDRRDALALAVQVHQGLGTYVDAIVETAKVFEAYVRGE